MQKPTNKIAPSLLAWYDRHRRAMPWRALPGQKPNPYYVWLSEVMLQQTTVATVGAYFLKFIKKWPDLTAFSKASLEEVQQMWAGLGYYRRARALHECAQAVKAEHGGVFPQEEEKLLALPGIGPYTAAAIRAIAFDQEANVVDGNVERVMARLFVIDEPLPKSKKALKQLAAGCLPESRFGDYAQALMDLGATVCTPRSPKCDLCPLASSCKALKAGKPQDYPRKTVKQKKPVRTGYAFVLIDKKKGVFLRRRGEAGLLAGMMEVPGSPWEARKKLAWSEAQSYAPRKARWEVLSGNVHHVFTHFELILTVAVASGTFPALQGGVWVPLKKLGQQALPSVMRKVIAFAMDQMETKA